MALGGTAPYDFVDCQWTVHVKCQYDAAKRVRRSLKAQARDHALGKSPAALAAPVSVSTTTVNAKGRPLDMKTLVQMAQASRAPLTMAPLNMAPLTMAPFTMAPLNMAPLTMAQASREKIEGAASAQDAAPLLTLTLALALALTLTLALTLSLSLRLRLCAGRGGARRAATRRPAARRDSRAGRQHGAQLREARHVGRTGLEP